MINCEEFCKLLNLPRFCCWGCYENNAYGKDLMFIHPEVSGLSDVSYVCCNCKYQMEKLMETTTIKTQSVTDKLLQLTQEINHLGRVLHRKNKKIRNQHETLAQKNAVVRSMETVIAELLEANAKLGAENMHLRDKLEGR